MGTTPIHPKDDIALGFLNHLHDEKVKTQGERANYIVSKLAFVIGFFGLGSFKIENFLNLNWLLYFVPIIAICYDLYINATDSSIKKIGAFIRGNSVECISGLEKQWERFSAKKRDIFAPIANFIVTIAVTVASCAGSYFSFNKTVGIWLLWYVVIFFIAILIWGMHHIYISSLDEDKKQNQP